MNKKKNMSSIEKNVMSQITTGRAKMHSKIYYTVLGSLSILMILVFSSVNAYVMSLVTFWLRIQASQGPAYGAKRNLAELIDSFPWWALLVGALSLIIAVFFVRKVGGMYKIRWAYLVISVIAMSFILGFLLSYSSLPNVFNRHSSAYSIFSDK